MNTKRLLVTMALISLLYGSAQSKPGPAGMDVSIDSADATYRTTILSILEKKRDAIEEADLKLLSVYEARLAIHRQDGNTEKAVAMRDAANRLTNLLASKPSWGSLPRPENRWKFREHSYAIIEEDKHWHEAKRNCERMGGYLAIISDNEEFKFIARQLPPESQGFLLGASDEAKEGDWRWVDGSPVQADLRKEFNNRYGIEHYLKMNKTGNLIDTSSTRSHFLCEWND